LEFRIEHKESFHIVGVKKRITILVDFENNQYSDLWKDFTPEMIAELKNLGDTTPTGILSISLSFGKQDKASTDLEQFIGVATTREDFSPIWDVYRYKTTDFAVFTTVGNFPYSLQELWNQVYSQWLFETDYNLSGEPDILWNEGVDFTKPDFQSEIWVPLLMETVSK
jgi:AraC family transcriptional regulator